MLELGLLDAECDSYAAQTIREGSIRGIQGFCRTTTAPEARKCRDTARTSCPNYEVVSIDGHQLSWLFVNRFSFLTRERSVTTCGTSSLGTVSGRLVIIGSIIPIASFHGKAEHRVMFIQCEQGDADHPCPRARDILRQELDRTTCVQYLGSQPTRSSSFALLAPSDISRSLPRTNEPPVKHVSDTSPHCLIKLRLELASFLERAAYEARVSGEDGQTNGCESTSGYSLLPYIAS